MQSTRFDRVRRRVVLGAFALLVALSSSITAGHLQTSTATVAWDRNRDGAAGYYVHVGTESGVYDEQFDAGSKTSFTFSGISGVRYYFAVSAYDAWGRVSGLSAEVSTIIGGADTPVASQRCAGPSCPSFVQSAGSLGAVSAAAALPDGRLLVVEGDGRVRFVDQDGLAVTPSLAADARVTVLNDIVVDPWFERTSYVFVGMTEPGRDGGRQFRITRYRLVSRTLGEGATVVSGLTYHGDHPPRFAVDHDGNFYVAMPDTGAARDPYAGRLLRFAPDGSVPSNSRGLSPVIADSVSIPSDVDWDGNAVWVSGIDRQGRRALARLAVRENSDEWPRPLATVSVTRSARDVLAFDVTSAPSGAKASPAVIADSSLRLFRLPLLDDGSLGALEPIAWPGNREPVDVVLGPDGSLHVIAKTPEGTFEIFRAGCC